MGIIRRRMMMTLSLSLVLLILVRSQLSTAILSSSQQDECAEQKCSPDSPAIRFPFVVQGKQPDYCGYDSSFNLRCDEKNRTILELPSTSIKVEVTNISYLSQMMEVRSVETCFAKHLRYLDISTTPFFYQAQDSNGDPYYYDPVNDYSFFNCSAARNISYPEWFTVGCLGNNGYKVMAVYKDTRIRNMAEVLESCKKMYNTKLVPTDLFHIDFMKLVWSLPPCRKCELQGGVCRWKDRRRNKIGCSVGNKHLSGTLKKLLISGPIIGCLFLALATGAIYLAYSKNKLNKEDRIRLKKFLEDYAAMKPTRYSYADLKKITNDFKDKLGEGGNANVFKGKVSNEIFVAVKVLHSSSENDEEFISEVGTMGRIHHVNVVRLLGFCADGYKKALVFEFLPNGSLDKVIFPDGQEDHTLGMDRLQNIAVGIARGIEYLHQGCEQRILHFDIKPHNILLDENYNPKISDFGLAKLCEKEKSAVSMTAVRGTMGYIAPEVFSRQFGNVSYKSDIYSFGMLLLEMVGRRKNIDCNVQNISQIYFPEWIYGRLVNGEEIRIQVDDEDDGEGLIAKKLAIVGLWCIQWSPANRPSITFVLQMLDGIIENLNLPPNPFALGNAVVNSADPSTEHTRLPLDSTLTVISESANIISLE